MKKLAIIILFFISIFYLENAYAQNKKIKLFVNGACGMCEKRIEKAALATSGVEMAEWELASKNLTVELNKNTFEATILHQNISSAGHDTKQMKAPDSVYNKLPECCKYREEDKKQHENNSKATHKHNHHHVNTISGNIQEKNSKGETTPLVGANVYWAGTTQGTITDKKGNFSLSAVHGKEKIVISYVGFTNDTIETKQNKFISIIKSENIELDEVNIIHRQKSTQVSFIDPVKKQIMGEKELTKAACCNLSESFETNPTVDVSFTDAVTGTRQIKMLGLASPYVQITRENMPDIRGLSSLYGFTFTPGPWIESIQLNTGTGSVVNGYESITGQINVELQKPQNSEKLYLNLYTNEGSKVEANANFAHQVNEKWSTGLLLHGSNQSREWDKNNDGFLDHPLNKQAIVLHRWKFEGNNGLQSQFGIKATYTDKTSGQKGYSEENIADEDRWGAEIDTRRIEGWFKIGKVFENRPATSLGFQMSAAWHEQDAVFGLRNYDAIQQNLYANLIFQSFIGHTNHQFKTGASFQADNFNETVAQLDYDRNEVVPGIFYEYSWLPNDKFTVVAGIRGDYHNQYGLFATPRLHLRYAPADKSVFRISAGRGLRTASIFAENIGIFASNRSIIIHHENTENPYGLNPEIAWNMGANFTQEFSFAQRTAVFSMDYYRTQFKNQIVIDFDRSPQQVHFYNLQGESWSNSFQTQLDVEVLPRFDVRLAYRFNDVKTQYSGELRQKPLTAKHRAFINFAYETLNKWRFDFTLNRQGSKRIPDTESNPEKYQLAAESPAFYLANTQISKTWRNKFEIYLGAENLFNYKQPNPILASEAPFSNYFDSSLIWGPVFGRKIYMGLRFRLQ